jgi:GT2 family glycosyltransferase
MAKETDPQIGPAPVVDAVVIGRNEGLRLQACLRSLATQTRRIVYVDSGSTDGSVQVAQSLGAEVVALDLDRPFTAARARNAGLARLALDGAEPDFVQFVDGDCAVDPQWVHHAREVFGKLPDAVVVCGRRRERFPEVSVYNRLCDREWDTPVGPARACGGDALMRFSALQAVGGYREDLIAGEEPELCIRLRQRGGTIWRIDAEMTLHDAAITRFAQFWKRSKRAGHAFAEGAALHGAPPERHWVRETRRAVFWGAALPVAAVLGAVLIHPALIGLLLAWPLQVLRLARSWRGEGQVGREAALMWVPAKLAEAQGALGFWIGRILGRRRGLIEYK